MGTICVCDAGYSIAGSPAEISVVSFGVDDPIIPTNCRKINVQRISTAFARIRSAVDASRLTTHSFAGKCVDHDERFVIVVIRDRKFASIACFTHQLYCVRQVVILHPILHGPCNVNFFPLFSVLEFINRNRLCLREV